MRIQEAKIALEVAQQLSFSLAAERLGMVNSKITRVITNLEQEYGHAIFSRTTRRMSITNYGEVLLRHARTMVAEDANIRLEMSALAQGKAGSLILGYSGNVITDILPKVIAKALGDLPDIVVNTQFAWAQEISEKLNNSTIDVGFISDVSPRTGLESLHIVNKEVFFIMSDKHPLSQRDFVQFSDVEKEPFIVGSYMKWRFMRNMLDLYFGKHKKTYHVLHEADDPTSLEVLVQYGLGISINYDLPNTPLRPGLVRVSMIDNDTHIPVYAQWRLNNANPVLGTFVNLLEQMKSSFSG